MHILILNIWFQLMRAACFENKKDKLNITFKIIIF